MRSCAFLVWLLAVGVGSSRADLRVSPDRVVLDSPESSQQLLVTSNVTGHAEVDGTRVSQYQSLNERVAAVDVSGMVQPRGEGKTEIVVRGANQEVRVPVEVRGVRQPSPISFEHQVIPILTKAGCNAGGCHGKAEGQNGFKLSVFGFDPEADFQSLVKEARGRRIFPAAPEHSLLLRKGAAQVPHGGGKKLVEGSLPYLRLRRWIAEGARFEANAASPVKEIVVEPGQRSLALGAGQQLRVTAIDAGGTRRCVTAEAQYDSNAPTLAGVDGRGLVQAGDVPGEAAILVKYMGLATVCRVTMPRPGVTFARPPENNFIDRLVWDKLQRLGIPPSERADDATILRRTFLDVLGTLPTAAEARAYVSDPDPAKHGKLIDQVLRRPEYADYWAMRWADVLRVDRDVVGAPGAVAITRWLRGQFAENRPYDRIVHDILTVQGPTHREGPAAFYRSLDKPEVMSRSFSQLFLGVRIECAQCHHHPSEKWSQDDYAALVGFFTGVSRKALPGGGEAVVSRGGEDGKHPRTGKPVAARALAAAPADFSKSSDRRVALAEWVVRKDNPFFARAIANRLWAHYLGRGLVVPLDDLRTTNPASNEPLLDALADHLRDVGYDLRTFTKTILTSRVYQLSSQPNPSNEGDEQNFSHASFKAMPAEVLLDAIVQVTGVGEKLNGWPAGVRAIQVWDNRTPSYFFRIFGRPGRLSVCECERSNEPSIAQALHLMNSDEITGKVRSRHGRSRRLAESKKAPKEIVEELYLTALARYPSARETAVMLDYFSEGEGQRRSAVEDAMWTLLNSKEFLFNR